jgi:hypothetical protein
MHALRKRGVGRYTLNQQLVKAMQEQQAMIEALQARLGD